MDIGTEELGWFVSKNGTQYGPLPEPEVRQWLKDGRLTWNDLAWRDGLQHWVAVGSVVRGAGPPLVPEPDRPTAGIVIVGLITIASIIMTLVTLPAVYGETPPGSADNMFTLFPNLKTFAFFVVPFSLAVNIRLLVALTMAARRHPDGNAYVRKTLLIWFALLIVNTLAQPTIMLTSLRTPEFIRLTTIGTFVGLVVLIAFMAGIWHLFRKNRWP